MWSQAIIFQAEVFYDHAGFCQRIKQFAVQAFVSELSVEALHEAVLPWAARFYVECFDLMGLKPLLEFFGYKLRSVVRSDVFWRAMLIDQFAYSLDDAFGFYRAIHFKAVAFTGVFIDHG